jgi:hypothetical protein
LSTLRSNSSFCHPVLEFAPPAPGAAFVAALGPRAIVVGDHAVEAGADRAAELRPVPRRVPDRSPFLARRENCQFAGQLEFDDLRQRLVVAFLVLGDRRRMGEREPDVVGGGLTEVAHHEFDDVPVGGVLLHEHRYVRPDLVGLALVESPELAVQVDQRGDAERQGGPRGDRQPARGPETGEVPPAVLNPFHRAPR